MSYPLLIGIYPVLCILRRWFYYSNNFYGTRITADYDYIEMKQHSPDLVSRKERYNQSLYLSTEYCTLNH